MSIGVPSGAELLAQIPEALRDEPMEELIGLTPREAAQHVDTYSCLACRGELRRLGKEAA